jgi:hypothetical protein
VLLGAVLYRGAQPVGPVTGEADASIDPDMPRPGSTPGLDERLAV